MYPARLFAKYSHAEVAGLALLGRSDGVLVPALDDLAVEEGSRDGRKRCHPTLWWWRDANGDEHGTGASATDSRAAATASLGGKHDRTFML